MQVDPYRAINKLITDVIRASWSPVVGTPVGGLGEVGRPREPGQGTRGMKLRGSFPCMTKSSALGL
jgi:hypothetical protein